MDICAARLSVFVSAGALVACSDKWLLLTCHPTETLGGWACSVFMLLACPL